MLFLSREKAQRALWFAETYGLNLKSLNMEDQSGRPISIGFTSNSASFQNEEPYKKLNNEEKENIKTILFIMDHLILTLDSRCNMSHSCDFFMSYTMARHLGST